MNRTSVSSPVVLGGSSSGAFADQPWPRPSGSEQTYLGQVVTQGTWSSAGPFETAFEQRFTNYHRGTHGLCVANGTVALQLALEALDIGVGDEVIVPAYTWQATAAAVLDVNAVPVLVDVDEDSCCIDPAATEAAVTSRTRAVIAVHLYSVMANMNALRTIADRHNLALVEDCAHAHGSAWDGTGAGALGDVGTFSFQSSKSLTCGEGGFVMTRDLALHQRLDSLRNCGRRRGGARPVQSGNFRITEWQAAVLTAQFEKFPAEFQQRATNRHWLDKALADVPGVTPMSLHGQVRRAGMYAYAFRYEADEFAELPISAFRQALSQEIGVPLRAPYRPLNNSALYQPLTKRRYYLSDEHRARLDPSKQRFPVAERAFNSAVVIIPHQYLLACPEEVALIPDAIEKLHEYASELACQAEADPTMLPSTPE